MVITALIAGFAAGLVVGWLLGAIRIRAERDAKAATLEERAHRADTDLAASRAAADALRERLTQQDAELSKVRGELAANVARVAASETSAAETQRRLEEQQQLLASAESRLTETFKALAAEALGSNNENFLLLAGQRLGSFQKEAAVDLEKRQQAIESIITPARESLKRIDEEIRAMEKDRVAAQTRLSEQLGSLSIQTDKLVNALRSPTVRGRWGEIQLRRVVEIAGMKDHCDFFEQQTVETDDGNRRPDMRIELPGGKNVVVDAKVPLQAYMEAIDAATDSERATRLSDHARQVRAHIEALADRAYWDACRPTPEFVVLFLPGEMFFSAALQQDPSLIEDGARKRVILATPTTLIALLKAVFYGWRQEQLAENARRISEAGQTLYERMATMSEHFGRMGASLSASVKAYNSAVGSMKDRVFPAARRLKELGVASKKEIEEIEEIDSAPRQAMLPIVENGDRDSNGK